jgi:septal ring factor EnvC (AmiA/AmiB activator)
MIGFRKYMAFLILLAGFSALAVLSVQAQKGRSQSRVSLVKDRSAIESEIRITNMLLKETRSRQDKSLGELSLLKKQIELREALIQSLNEELVLMEGEIAELNEVICQMEDDIQKIRQNYARTAQLTYKTLGDENFALAVFSSKNPSQAYFRIRYFRQFTNYRKKQVSLIRRTQTFLTGQTAELEKNLKEKAQAVEEKRAEMNKLESERVQQNNLFAKLKKQESDYRRSLAKQQSDMKKILRDLEKKAPVSPAKTAKKPASPGKTVPASSTAILKGKTFIKNKGKLPWPLPGGSGIITGKYGITKDDYGNRVSNDGVFISTAEGQKVFSVFEGTVTGVKQIPFSGSMVIVGHGNYRTVYANLSAAYVKEGDEVSTGQELGVVRTDSRSHETVLNFLIYKVPSAFENPEYWLLKK